MKAYKTIALPSIIVQNPLIENKEVSIFGNKLLIASENEDKMLQVNIFTDGVPTYNDLLEQIEGDISGFSNRLIFGFQVRSSNSLQLEQLITEYLIKTMREPLFVCSYKNFLKENVDYERNCILIPFLKPKRLSDFKTALFKVQILAQTTLLIDLVEFVQNNDNE